MIISGLTFVVEGTGGGNKAAVAYVEGGVIAMTDGNLGVDFRDAIVRGETFSAGFYPGATWLDSGQPSLVDGEGMTPDAAVERLLRNVADRTPAL